MPVENPTAGDSGASIEERLERFLSAEDAPAPEQNEPQSNAEPEQAAEEPQIEPESGEQEESQQPQITTTDFAKVLGIDESMAR